MRTGRDGDPPPDRRTGPDWPIEPSCSAHLDRFRVPDVDHIALIDATAEFYEFPMCDRDPLHSGPSAGSPCWATRAHPMYPVGSNGAAQAIIDGRAWPGHLVEQPDPDQALRAYQAERLPATSQMVLSNRVGGRRG